MDWNGYAGFQDCAQSSRIDPVHDHLPVEYRLQAKPVDRQQGQVNGRESLRNVPQARNEKSIRAEEDCSDGVLDCGDDTKTRNRCPLGWNHAADPYASAMPRRRGCNLALPVSQ